MKRNWSTKEEYLQFVQEWKQVYKDLSLAIRLRKQSRKLLKNRPGVTQEQEDAEQINRDVLLAKVKVATGVPFWNDSAMATSLLAMRKEEKERAGLARQASLDAKAAQG